MIQNGLRTIQTLRSLWPVLSIDDSIAIFQNSFQRKDNMIFFFKAIAQFLILHVCPWPPYHYSASTLLLTYLFTHRSNSWKRVVCKLRRGYRVSSRPAVSSGEYWVVKTAVLASLDYWLSGHGLWCLTTDAPAARGIYYTRPVCLHVDICWLATSPASLIDNRLLFINWHIFIH